MKDGSHKVRHASAAAWTMAIVMVSAAMAMTVYWRAPGVNLYARDRLMQTRGPLSPPEDIVIVGIDEASIERFGRFPWSRALTAHALDTISAAQPKAIAVDVLYSEPTTNADDTTLVEAIRRSGNTVVAAQLIETTDEAGAAAARWLRPLPLIESSAAAVGHANVAAEADGEARELPLRKADDEGLALWSMAIETIRVGEGIRNTSLRDVVDGVRLGPRVIPIAPVVPTVGLGRQGASLDGTLRADQMVIDYIGPPGSFSHQTYSFAEVLDGRVPPQSLRGKYVLIGATAATLGDHVSSPFMHAETAAGKQHGELMPGVEVLANSMNTILRGRFYRETADWLVALLAALVAAAVLGSLAIAQGRFESVKQISALLGLLAVILVASYMAFVHWLIVPPVVAALVSFTTAAPLALLRRSLMASADLDSRIAELTGANDLLPLSAPELVSASNFNANPAALIARLSGANSVAIYVRDKRSSDYRVAASYGTTAMTFLTEDELQGALTLGQVAPNFSITNSRPARLEEPDQSILLGVATRADSDRALRQLRLRLAGNPGGVLILRTLPEHEISTETLRLCVEITMNYVGRFENEEWNGSPSLSASWGWHFPHGLAWKTRALGLLNQRMLDRARFVDRALRSAEEGLIVADLSGCIAFANARAAEILGVPERGLVGSDLFRRLKDLRHPGAEDNQPLDRVAREVLMRVVIERTFFASEIKIGEAPPRYYILRISPVTSEDNGAGQLLGLVVALSDVTQQHELQEMKTDVMTLVSHELRTPLTAIQGMSEVLSQFEVDEERRREMHLTINDEAKRLSQMINEYLDITRLESGARQLRLAPVRIAPLIERVLLLLDPIAAQRKIRIVRRLTLNLPGILADADLIAQAMTNLVANAIKYSSAKTEIVVETRASSDALFIEVADQGYGIPAGSLNRIFEKFYRIPRVEDADVRGTGLGLALVREIVELHGGRVTVESEPGVGSTFSLRLPLPRKEN